ncbi:Glutamyl-tRNA(Gln) amidotransferase subunit A [bioreactor metagenome]|uniref:Glutamyl-tRNA(Gln) amidotransferase subunit A n=1 Tax=bioreactor metagenome TaxID=1076179 RepID=A0A645ENN3_9ZZZZ
MRQLIKREFVNAFKSVDTILLPTAPTPAFRKGELVNDPIQMYMADVFTLPVNLAGLPGLSLNAGFSKDGRPLGVQFIGSWWGEEDLLSIAALHEKAYGTAPIAQGGVC